MNSPASSKGVDDERAEHGKDKEAVCNKSKPGKRRFLNIDGFGWKLQIEKERPSCEKDAGHGQAHEHGHENDQFDESLFHRLLFVDSK